MGRRPEDRGAGGSRLLWAPRPARSEPRWGGSEPRPVALGSGLARPVAASTGEGEAQLPGGTGGRAAAGPGTEATCGGERARGNSGSATCAEQRGGMAEPLGPPACRPAWRRTRVPGRGLRGPVRELGRQRGCGWSRSALLSCHGEQGSVPRGAGAERSGQRVSEAAAVAPWPRGVDVPAELSGGWGGEREQR